MTIGGKLCLAGTIVALAGGALLAQSLPWPPTPVELRLQPGGAALAGAGVLLVVVGLVVYVVQPALDRNLAARVPIASIRTSLAMFALAVLLANLATIPVIVRLGPRAVAGSSVGPGTLLYLIVASEIPIIFVVWLRLVLPGGRTWGELGLRLRPIDSHVSLGLLGGLALFISAGIVGAVLTRFGIHQNQLERFEGIEGSSPLMFLLALLAGCVLAPLAEELFFRGYVFKTFLDQRGPAWAYLYSSGLFALVHANLAAAAPIFVLGLILAYLFQRSNSAVPGMIAHGLNNAIAFVLLYKGLTG